MNLLQRDDKKNEMSRYRIFEYLPTCSLSILKIMAFKFLVARARSLIRLDDDPVIHLAALSQTALGSEGPIKRKDTCCSRLLAPDSWDLWFYCEMSN